MVFGITRRLHRKKILTRAAHLLGAAPRLRSEEVRPPPPS